MTRRHPSPRRFVALIACAAAWLVVVSSNAQHRDAVAIDVIVRAAEQSLSRGDIDDAVDGFEQAMRVAPTSRQARRASVRLAWIRARAEGGYVPLQAMQRFYALSAAERDRARVEAFEHAAWRMPDGRVRIESLRAVCSEWMRLSEPSRAASTYARLYDDAGLDDGERAAIVGEWAAALRAAGHDEQALSLLLREGHGQGACAKMIARERLARWAMPLSVTVLVATFLVAFVASLRRGWRAAVKRLTAPSSLLRIAYVAVGPWLIASAYDDETSDTFAALAVGVGVVLVSAELFASACRGRRWTARAASAGLLLAASASVAYLVLLHSGGTLGVL